MIERGCVTQEAHIPGEWRARAKRCFRLADETTKPTLKESLTDIAQKWMGLASDLEVTKRLLDGWGRSGHYRQAGMLNPAWPPQARLTRRFSEPENARGVGFSVGAPDFFSYIFFLLIFSLALARLPAGSFMNSVLAASLPKQ
jgi:hypothetical protein